MKWVELTSDDFAEAREKSQGVAMIPVGSLERHGPHLPVGCDTLTVQRVAGRVEEIEPVVVLPVLPYTHVAVCVYHPGAIHIRQDVLLDFVNCICEEVYRNGFEKIVLLHGHGGNIPLNSSILAYSLERCKPYALYSIDIGTEVALQKELKESASAFAGHAGEFETSWSLHLFPHLVKMDRVQGMRCEPDASLDVAPAKTPVDWIARWPKMTVGEPDKATADKGRRLFEARAACVAEALRKIKKDTVVPNLLRQRAQMGKA